MDFANLVLDDVRDFLADDLAREFLPPHVEEKRQVLLEQLDLLTFGPCPPTPPPVPPSPPHPLDRRTTVPKRHSMPPTFASQQCRNAAIADPLHSSISRYATPSASFRPSLECSHEVSACVHYHPTDASVPAGSAASPLYEEPLTLIQRHARLPSRPSSMPVWESKQPPTVTTITRRSMSPHLGFLTAAAATAQSSSSSMSHRGPPVRGDRHLSPMPPRPTFAAQTPPVDNTDHGTLMLPKRSVHSSRRVPVYFTLSGPLYYRYKPRKWSRLGHCVLTPGAHLLGFKSSHALTPSVAIFISGSTSAVYSGRDSGMDHVIKITHSTSPHKANVFATDSEAEAMTWIDQINQYAQGITPCPVHGLVTRRTPEPADSSMADFARTTSMSTMTVSTAHLRKTATPRDVRPKSLFLFPCTTPSNCDGLFAGTLEHQLHASGGNKKADLSDATQEDSGFSGVLSSSSSATEGACGDVYLNAERGHPPSLRGIANSSSSPRNSTTYDLLQSRASGLFSSVRRKVESLSSRRRSVTLTGGARRPTIIEADVFSPPPTPPPLPASCVTTRGDALLGFGWSQLESESVEKLLSSGGGGSSGGGVSTPSPKVRAWRSMRGASSKTVTPRQPLPKPSESSAQSVLSCEAYIRVPGRLPWTKRWCVLRSSVLEIFSSNRPPSASTSGPVFSLPLQPGLVEVSLAEDKLRRSAIRLSAPNLSAVPLLFDAGDTVTMGQWIRGIIIALGLLARPPAVSTASATHSMRGIPANSVPPTNCALHSKSRRYSDIVPSSTSTSACRSLSATTCHPEVFAPVVFTGDEPDATTDPVYDEVAAVLASVRRETHCVGAVASLKRWSLPPHAPMRLSEVTPLPPLPSAGPSSGASSLCDGVYSSVYDSTKRHNQERVYDSVMGSISRRTRSHSETLHSKSSPEPTSHSLVSLATDGFSSCYLFRNASGHWKNRRCRSLDWDFMVTQCTSSQPRNLLLLSESNTSASDWKKVEATMTDFLSRLDLDCCSSGDKVASYLDRSSESTPVTAVARSFSCMSSGTSRKASEEVQTPRGLTMPLSRLVQPSSPPPGANPLEFKLVERASEKTNKSPAFPDADSAKLTTSQLADGLEDALLALVSVAEVCGFNLPLIH
uniref:PH domain-containing protein n=1 Tax=Mesocestoides corti TaxID=53468 RepID=A0A5K3FPY7_MESCO